MMRAILTALLMLLPTAAGAMVCGPREGLLEALTKRLGQEVRAVAVTGSGALVEVFVSEEQWTVLISGPLGQSCIILEGQTIEFITPGEDT